MKGASGMPLRCTVCSSPSHRSGAAPIPNRSTISSEIPRRLTTSRAVCPPGWSRRIVRKNACATRLASSRSVREISGSSLPESSVRRGRRSCLGVSSMPARSASMRIVSPNPIPWYFWMNVKTSPPAPHTKQWNIRLCGTTYIEGLLSSWNGHKHLNSRPLGTSRTYSPTTSAMSDASSTFSLSSSSVDMGDAGPSCCAGSLGPR